MTDRDTLAALVARVEAATGPSIALDVAIFDAVGHFAWWDKAFGDSPRADRDAVLFRNARAAQFAPTASLEAAVALVPEGWGREFWHEPGERAQANVWPPRRRTPRETRSGFAATPALALTAAALRARMEARDAR